MFAITPFTLHKPLLIGVSGERGLFVPSRLRISKFKYLHLKNLGLLKRNVLSRPVERISPSYEVIYFVLRDEKNRPMRWIQSSHETNRLERDSPSPFTCNTHKQGDVKGVGEIENLK